MTSKNLKSAIWLTLAAGVLALASGGVALGKGRPADPGGGGKGNKPPTEVGNNLSVPAIMAGGMGAFTALACGDAVFTALVPPTGDPLFYPASDAETPDGPVHRDAGYFYVQRIHTWKSPCMVVTGATVNAIGAWGDNLAGSASLKVGSPIRVELVLWDADGLADLVQPGGYAVEKLDLTELDRLSDYGHRAGGIEGAWDPYEQDLGAIVHDPSARLKVEKIENGLPVSIVYDQPAGGEINATGKIIYGYGLRVTEPGTYRLTYSFTNVNITGCEEAAADCDDGSTAILDINVGSGGGGGRPPNAGE